jgi:hypothetical protein
MNNLDLNEELKNSAHQPIPREYHHRRQWVFETEFFLGYSWKCREFWTVAWYDRYSQIVEYEIFLTSGQKAMINVS